MKKILLIFLILMIFTLSFKYQSVYLNFGTDSIEVIQNELKTVPVIISNVKDLYGFSFHIEFEPEFVSIESIDEGDFLKKDKNETFFLYKVDNERREIIIGASRKSKISGVNGDGNLIFIKFKLKTNNKTFFNFKEVSLKDSNLKDIDFISKNLTIYPQTTNIPKISVEPNLLTFRTLDQILEIRIKNIGKGTLKGSIYTKDDWIAIDKNTFEGNTTVYVAIKKVVDYEGLITIESNGGNYEVRVKFEKPTSVRIILQIGNQVAYVNNEPFLLPFPPFIKNGRTMVPLRFIAEQRGAQVLWYAQENKVLIIFNEIFIELWVDQNKNYVRLNGVFHSIEVAPYTYNGRTVVPVRFISEFLNGKVEWVDETKTVIINFDST
ncbi:MAG TPA: stalk domain-containing protein [Caldisericia bacterium]|nr:stalk domain-containing protein [Caldisericia bacterium]HRU74326.1 stalk domain-containing protein [Caldisericia bacterium]